LYKFLSEKPIKDLGDDQLHLTNLYLNSDLRENLNIKLDNYASLFQNLYLAEGWTLYFLADFENIIYERVIALSTHSKYLRNVVFVSI